VRPGAGGGDVGRIRKDGRPFSWGDVRSGVRFAAGLPAFLRRPWKPEEARAALRRRFEKREDNFLGLLRACATRGSRNPYRALLRRAGCEYGDLVALAAHEGVESALKVLFRNGVYLTVEEFKGRRPVVRGDLSLEAAPGDFSNHRRRVHLTLRSGGSRSSGTPVSFDLRFLGECAADTGLALHVRGGDAWRKATWEVPGGGALFSLLEFSRFGVPPDRWFSQLDPSDGGLHPRYRWANRALAAGAALAGFPMPRPEHVPLENPKPIVNWMAGTLRSGRTPCLLSYPSSALRVSRAAIGAGVDLRGAQMTIAGEPCTASRLEAVRSTGASVSPKYGIMETGPVGYGCLEPEAPDDVHLLDDLHAVILADGAGKDGPRRGTVFFTSLSPSAPLLLLNVSMGDTAVLTERACGCPLQELGWRMHLHSIRSREKLTCGGMNFMDTDVMRVLEVDLPARFGGGATDYQLLEEEGPDGTPALKLLAAPRIGPLDDEELKRAFLESLARGGGAEAVMSLAWREGRLLSVERRPPLATASGKILHLHLRQDKAGGDAGRRDP